jgi:hypothetical protein
VLIDEEVVDLQLEVVHKILVITLTVVKLEEGCHVLNEEK